MDYTVDDLRGKWVNKGTQECKIFLDQLYKLGLIPSQLDVSYFGGDVIAVCDGDFVLGLWREENTCFTNDKMFTPKPQWSIYTNDKPLCELSDEQYGKMRRAHDNGLTVQTLDDDGYGFQDCGLPTWISNGVYRIKQKSERELFIEKCVELTHDGINKHLFEVLFNAGCRFTED